MDYRRKVIVNEKSSDLLKMSLAPKWFALFKSGKKNVEVRLFDEKRQGINVGDLLEMVNAQTNESVTARVRALYRFGSFIELGQSALVNACGFEGMTPDEIEALMRGFYSEADEKRYGVLAIETEVEK